jgi:hypothetical protein
MFLVKVVNPEKKAVCVFLAVLKLPLARIFWEEAGLTSVMVWMPTGVMHVIRGRQFENCSIPLPSAPDRIRRQSVWIYVRVEPEQEAAIILKLECHAHVSTPHII